MKTHMVIHHSLTADSGTVSWSAIRNYHLDQMGWRDIGYHLGVERIGDRYEMLVGRPLRDRAAAAYQRNMNYLGIHVCFVGDYDAEPPPDEMLAFAAPHLTDICEVFDINLDAEHVIGHTRVAPYKTCPGSQFDLERFINLMRGS